MQAMTGTEGQSGAPGGADPEGLVGEFLKQRIGRREFIRRASLVGISAAGATALLDACTGGSTTTAAGPKQTTLRYGPDFDPGTLDTLTNNYDYPYPPFNTVFEGLTRYPPGTTWRPVNTLAESIEASPDGKTVVFTLKKGIPFHGGYGELTAEDVKYSFERAVGKEKLYPDASKSDVSYYGGDFLGLREVQVTGKYSGKVLFDTAFAPFSRLTLPYATSGLIVSKKAVEKLGKSGWLKKPIGTGPYEVVSYTPNQQLIMKRFDEYGGAAGHASQFPWEEIRFSLVAANAAPTGAAKTAAVQSGDIDFTYSITPLDAKRLQVNPALRTYAIPTPLNYYFMTMNVQHPKLKDVRVRQAIRYAIDVPALIQAQNLDLSTRQNALIVPQMGVGYWPGAPSYTRDVAKAKSLLREAGISSLAIDLATPDIGGIPTAKDVMEVIQSNLADAGIKATIRLSVPDSYTKNATDGQLSWSRFGGAPDPYYQFEWFTCSQIGTWNWAFWCNKGYTHMENQIAAEPQPAARTNTAIAMQQLMDESAAFIWSNHDVINAVSRSSIRAAFDPNGNPVVQLFRQA